MVIRTLLGFPQLSGSNNSLVNNKLYQIHSGPGKQGDVKVLGVFYSWALGLGLSFVFLSFFYVCAFYKRRKLKRSLHASLFFFSFTFSRSARYSFHSSIDLGGEEAPRENDK